MSSVYSPPPELVLGERLNARVPEVDEILGRLGNQPGVILADEVGMGKTFVALGVAYSVAVQESRGPVIVMVPPNLVDKWVQDFKTFCELYLDNCQPVQRGEHRRKDRSAFACARYAVARHSIELMKVLDDAGHKRCHLVFLAQGAMSRRQSDKWIRLALIGEALRRHGQGKSNRLAMVGQHIHRFLAELLWAIGEERANKWGEELWRELLQKSPELWKDIYNDSARDEHRKLAEAPVPKSVTRALKKIDLRSLAEALEQMPIRARGGKARVAERLDAARKVLRQVEEKLWKNLLAQTRWRSPLLVMDEAHHLKNPGTSLSRQLQSPELGYHPDCCVHVR